MLNNMLCFTSADTRINLESICNVVNNIPWEMFEISVPNRVIPIKYLNIITVTT